MFAAAWPILFLLTHAAAGLDHCYTSLHHHSFLLPCNLTLPTHVTLPQEVTHLQPKVNYTPSEVKPAVTNILEASSVVNELLAEENLAKLLSFLPPFSPRPVRSPECRAQSEIFLKELREMKMWALKMFDSTAKAGSGLLNGNIVLLGDYDQCLSVHRPLSSSQGHTQGHEREIRGQYCVATIYVEPVDQGRSRQGHQRSRLIREVVDLMQSHKAMSNAYEDDMRFLPTFNPISWAFCVPSACSPSDLQESLHDLLRPYNLTSGLDFKVTVSTNGCASKDTNKFDLGAVNMIIFLAGMLLLATWGTLHERSHTDLQGHLLPSATSGTAGRLLLAFSFQKNLRLLMDTSVAQDELSCVHGLRAIASLFIYLIHRSVFGMFYPYSNRTQVAELLEGDWTMLFRAFWNWVDSFVVFSGLLTSFYAVKRLQEGRSLNIPRMYLQRYVKFTPLLLVMGLMTQHLLPHFVSEPQLIRVVSHYVDNCRRGILPLVTYTNTFQGFENMCYPPSHQLATDMHMYLLAPFLILGAWRWPKRGFVTLAVTLMTLAVLKYVVVLKYGLGSFLYYGISIKQIVVSANFIYINAVHRLTPYIFGLALGFILRRCNGQCLLSKVQMAAGTAVALAGAFYSVYGVSHVARRDYIYEAREAAAFAVVQPVLWSFSLCWLIYCCATSRAPAALRRFLCWGGFLVFSRVSYAVYLVQIFIIAIGVGNVMTSEYFRVTKLVDLNEMFAVVGVSVLFTLLFLLPLQDLWSIAAGNYKAPSALPTSDAKVSDASKQNSKSKN